MKSYDLREKIIGAVEWAKSAKSPGGSSSSISSSRTTGMENHDERKRQFEQRIREIMTDIEPRDVICLKAVSSPYRCEFKGAVLRIFKELATPKCRAEDNDILNYFVLQIILSHDDSQTLDFVLDWKKELQENNNNIPPNGEDETTRRLNAEFYDTCVKTAGGRMESEYMWHALREERLEIADVLVRHGAHPRHAPVLFSESFLRDLPPNSSAWCRRIGW